MDFFKSDKRKEQYRTNLLNHIKVFRARGNVRLRRPIMGILDLMTTAIDYDKEKSHKLIQDIGFRFGADYPHTDTMLEAALNIAMFGLKQDKVLTVKEWHDTIFNIAIAIETANATKMPKQGSEVEKLKKDQREATLQAQNLKREIAMLRKNLEDEKNLKAMLQMQLLEMSKLSASVANKASYDELLKALRVFVNKSKHKRIEKRAVVKEMVLEMANANGILFPDDLAETIDSLDDEQPEPRIVNVAGNYNDIHDNGRVNNGR